MDVVCHLSGTSRFRTLISKAIKKLVHRFPDTLISQRAVSTSRFPIRFLGGGFTHGAVNTGELIRSRSARGMCSYKALSNHIHRHHNLFWGLSRVSGFYSNSRVFLPVMISYLEPTLTQRFSRRLYSKLFYGHDRAYRDFD